MPFDWCGVAPNAVLSTPPLLTSSGRPSSIRKSATDATDRIEMCMSAYISSTI